MCLVTEVLEDLDSFRFSFERVVLGMGLRPVLVEASISAFCMMQLQFAKKYDVAMLLY